MDLLDQLVRPRDYFDVDVHPESTRGKVLALYDWIDDALAKVDAARGQGVDVAPLRDALLEMRRDAEQGFGLGIE